MPEDPVVTSARQPDGGAPRRRVRLRQLWYVLLLVQFAGVLIPSIYSRETPKLGGVPFFYWYQMAWIVLSVLLTGLVYLMTREK